MKKKIQKKKGWIALEPESLLISHEGGIPRVYLQKTKPKVFYDGRKLKVVKCILSYEGG